MAAVSPAISRAAPDCTASPQRAGDLRLDGLQWGIGRWQSACIDLHLPAGQTLVLLGHNGAGKTALLDTLAGLVPPRAGRVFLGAREITMLPPQSRRIGYMFQRDALFPHWTIERNLRFGRGARADLDPLLDALELRPWLGHYPRQLSGGQRQRVALARALVGAPELLLLDEPLSAIDPEARPALRRTLAALLRAQAITTIVVTHDPSDARLLGDQVGVIDDGRLLQLGTAHEVFDRPADLRTARLVGVDNLWRLDVLAVDHRAQQPTVRLGNRGRAVLDWSGALPGAIPLRLGQGVTVAVRAEAVQPCHPGCAQVEPGTIALDATLYDARCEGPLWRLYAALECGLRAQAYALPAQWRELDLRPGDALQLRIRQQDLHLLT